MEQNSNNIVDIRYQQTGESSATPYFNLTDVKNEKDKKGRFIEFFR